MTTKKNEAQAAARLSELLADELMSLTGRDLEDAARAWGVDPVASADRIDDVFGAAVKSQNQEKLRAAKASRDKAVAQLSSGGSVDRGDREALIGILTERLADLRRDNPGNVTIQHRNLTELSDADLHSLLTQLSALEEK